MPEPTYVSEKVPRDVCDERSKRIEEKITNGLGGIHERLAGIEKKLDKNGNGKTIRWMIGIVITTFAANLTTIAIVWNMVNNK